MIETCAIHNIYIRCYTVSKEPLLAIYKSLDKLKVPLKMIDVTVPLYMCMCLCIKVWWHWIECFKHRLIASSTHSDNDNKNISLSLPLCAYVCV